MKTSKKLEGSSDFCQVDGNYSTVAPVVAREFKLTIIDSSHLPRRLVAELHFVEHELRRVWPQLKRDPLYFGVRGARDSLALLKRVFIAPSLAALLIVAFLVTLVLVLERNAGSLPGLAKIEDDPVQDVVMLPRVSVSQALSGKGVGTGEKGRVGFARGRGEGSAPQKKRAQGGGSGGMQEPLPAQFGMPPQPSLIPAAIPKLPPVNKLSLPVAGIDIDPALWKDLKVPVYGDPRSKSETPSNGPGNGGGMGTKQGTGIGEGDGPGVGPGTGVNMGDGPRQIGGSRPGGGSDNNPDDRARVLSVKEVEQRARLISKPEPHYTEEARRNQITGTVVLRVVFSSLGDVVDIRAVQSLPFGLTEKAIAAAREIRFVPATRGGHPVSVYMQLDYNFNLY